MAKGSRQVAITPNVDNSVTLRVHGDISASDGKELAGRLNAVIAYWNTVLGRNTAWDESLKLSSTTSDTQRDGVTRGLGDEPFRDGC